MTLESLSRPPFRPIETQVWQFFNFFPDLPKWLTSFLAKIASPLVLLLGILSLLSLPFSVFHFIDVLSAIVGAILLIAAFKPLKLRRHFGITLLFWNAIFQATLGLSQRLAPAVVLGLVINLYLLYQIKLYFTKK